MHGVTITELIEKMNLRNSTPQIDTDKIVLTHPDVNRPALQLTGFFDHFDRERVQIIGYVEQAYIKTMERDVKRQMFDKLTSSQIPCLVFSRSQEPDDDLLEYCNYYGVPCLVSDKTTSSLMAEVIRWLNVKLAAWTIPSFSRSIGFLRIASMIRNTRRPPSSAGSGSRFITPRFALKRMAKFTSTMATTVFPAGAACSTVWSMVVTIPTGPLISSALTLPANII